MSNNKMIADLARIERKADKLWDSVHREKMRELVKALAQVTIRIGKSHKARDIDLLLAIISLLAQFSADSEDDDTGPALFILLQRLTREIHEKEKEGK